MPYDKTKPYSCPCCGYWNGDMKYDYYKHQKPLIKDEKIRKAVRAWADANNIIEVCYDAVWNAFRMDDFTCSFDYDFDRHDGLVDTCNYTIIKLCGKEEE